MIIVADENIDRLIVQRLREYGHIVTWIAEIEPMVDDAIVLSRAFEANALLITKDKDFGELIYRRSLNSAGVLLLRITSFELEELSAKIQLLLESSGATLLSRFSVLTDSTLRIKPLPRK